MQFEFITEAAALTELEVLVMIYNLLLAMSVLGVCIAGFHITYMLLKKVVNMNK